MTLPPHVSRCVGKMLHYRFPEVLMRAECRVCLRFIQREGFNTGDTDILWMPNAQYKCINHIRKPRGDEAR